MYFTLSWRNLWRNKRRTIIVLASIFFAVLFATVMRSAQLGSYEYMIHSSAKMFTGYFQIQGEGFWDNRSIDKSFSIADSIVDKIKQVPEISSVTPRFEVFSLISHENETRIAQVIGISPETEDKMTNIKSRIVAGSYLNDASSGYLLGKGLAERLGAEPGDSLVIYGQGYHGTIAAANLPVIGIVKLPFSELDNSTVFMNISEIQTVCNAPGLITSLPIMVNNVQYFEKAKTYVETHLTQQKQVVLDWREMMPDLVQNIEVDNAGGIIMIAILYMVIGFGILGTIMMMISERARELAILISVGMKKIKLSIVSIYESILLALVGIISGIIGAIPIVWYFHQNPIRMTGEAAKTFDSLGIEAIFAFSIDSSIFIYQALVVFLITLIAATYPLFYIWKMQPIETLHS
jgi:ABC-type lipoprotein release transport system permease subunit